MKISGALFAVFLKFIGMGRYDCASCEFRIVGGHMTSGERSNQNI